MKRLIRLAEAGLIPDRLLRMGIRKLLKQRLGIADQLSDAEKDEYLAAMIEELRTSPLALDTDTANDQHYEVPAEFYRLVLGPRMKYSACWFESPSMDLAQAETDMLELTCQRANISDGMEILELGCGWGSLTIWIAERFPRCKITAVSNSNSQREFIARRAFARNLNNIRIITSDMQQFEINNRFDRVISVEMFEHMRNYELLLKRVNHWLAPDGKAFVHIFCHRDTPYLFETKTSKDWMGRYFFTGGIMPSENLLGRFDDHMQVESQWRVDGRHYRETCEQWLRNLDRNITQVRELFEVRSETRREAVQQVNRWRMFFMACSELFGYRDGSEWFVAHYLMKKRPAISEQKKIVSAIAAN